MDDVEIRLKPEMKTPERGVTEQIRAASTAGDYEAFAGLVGEYVQWCRARYRKDEWFVDQVFGHQSLASELAALPVSYGPPNGKTLVAFRDGQLCGGGAYRRLADGTCEMKRLFVPTRFSGTGTGRRLCEALIGTAQADGFGLMRLDTANLFTEAIALYKSVGFTECVPHHEYPQALMPYLVFMELPLDGSALR
ncbi:MAG: GNAT family N-acetyltransferase [Betaproteobacteria bacterium]